MSEDDRKPWPDGPSMDPEWEAFVRSCGEVLVCFLLGGVFAAVFLIGALDWMSS